MKVIVVLLFLFSVSYSLPFEDPEGCKLCKDNLAKLMDKAFDTLVQQEYLLVETVCKLSGEFETGGCTLGVIRHWSNLAKILYTTPDFLDKLCNYMDNNCPMNSKPEFIKEWSCDVCKSDLKEVISGANSDAILNSAIELLNGEVYCQALSNEESVATCQEYVTKFLPAAVKALTDHLKFNLISTCSELYGVC